MRRFIIALFLFLFLSVCAINAQTVNVTATITDPHAVTYANGSWSVSFVPLGLQNPSVYRLNGSTFTQSYSGSTNSSGALAVTLPDTNVITPSGAQWQFNITSYGGTTFSVVTPVTAGNPNLTALLSAAAVSIGGNGIVNRNISLGQTPFIGNAASGQTAPLMFFTDAQGNVLLQLSAGGTLTCVSGCGGGGGAVSSVFGRTGAVVAVANDYSISLIGGLGTNMATFLATPNSTNLAATLPDETGSGPAAFSISPVFTGIPAAPTASPGTNTTQIASTAYVLANAGAISGLVANCLPKAATSTSINTCSSASDNATTFSVTEPINSTGPVSSGTSPAGIGATANGGFGCTESTNTGWTPTALTDYIRCDNTLHKLVASNNGSAEAPLGGSGGFAGTVTYTTNQTASSADNNKAVIMNCSSACAYTVPATQPSTTWQAWVISVGSTTATIGLSGDTFNGGASVPVLNKYRMMLIAANTTTSTDYTGDAPISVAGGLNTNNFANSFQIAATIGSSNPQTAATNFGTAIGTPVSAASFFSGAIVGVNVYQALAGVGCSAGSNTAQPTITFNDANGNTQTIAGPILTISANGAVANGSGTFVQSVLDIQSNNSVNAITFTVASTLASTGCSTVPQYKVSMFVPNH